MPKSEAKRRHNFTDLTMVAVKAVYEATDLSKQGYSDAVRRQLAEHDAWTKGWFAEGIAQGLYLHDLKNENDFEHTQKFLAEDLERICNVAAYVGMGLAIGHTDVFSESLYRKLDPSDRFWVFDGVGFYKFMVAERPDHQSVDVPHFVEAGTERENAFYAGIGRGLWFSIGETEIDRIVDAVHSFPEALQAPIWRGIGFASTYAGGKSGPLDKLKGHAGKYINHLQIGCVTAILEQGTDSVPHREVAANAYVGKGIGEIFTLVSTLTNWTHKNGLVDVKPMSRAWMEDVLAALT